MAIPFPSHDVTTPSATLTLDQAESALEGCIKALQTKSKDDLAGQRDYIAGYIDCMSNFGQISEDTRSILHMMYFEGCSKEYAIYFLEARFCG